MSLPLPNAARAPARKSRGRWILVALGAAAVRGGDTLYAPECEVLEECFRVSTEFVRVFRSVKCYLTTRKQRVAERWHPVCPSCSAKNWEVMTLAGMVLSAMHLSPSGPAYQHFLFEPLGVRDAARKRGSPGSLVPAARTGPETLRALGWSQRRIAGLVCPLADLTKVSQSS